MQTTSWLDAPTHLQPLLSEAEGSEARGRWRVAREQYERVLREWSPRTPCGAAVARAVRRIARCFVEEGDLDGAMDTIAVARAIATQYDETGGIAHAINLEGIIERMRGDLGAAEQCFRAARALAWQAGERLLVAMIDQNLGSAANIRGDRVEAKLRYQASLTAYEKLGMSRAIGPLHNNLGMLHRDMGQLAEAERHFREALRNALSHGDVAGRLRTEANRAELYVLRRRFRKAKRICRRVLALGLAPDACHGSWLAHAFQYLGVVGRETGDFVAAERAFRSALAHAERQQDALFTAEILSDIAVLEQRRRRYPETLAALTRAHELFTGLTAHADLADVERQLEALERQFVDIVRRWGESIETADSYTQGHCQRVADLACQLAVDAGIEPAVLLWFRMGALLHDVGKLVVPLEVLNKAGALTPAEMNLMREHPVAGELLLSDTEFPWDIRPMIRNHHERWDGTGYPDRLRGEDIPLPARILCIADVYDALTSTRSYREAYAPDVAIAIMRAGAGQSFDPTLLDVFLERSLPTWRGVHTVPAARQPRSSASIRAMPVRQVGSTFAPAETRALTIGA